VSESRPRLGLSAAATWFLTMRLDSEAMKATAGMGGSGLVWWSPFVMLLLVLALGLSYALLRRRARLILARRRAPIPR
jgi:heme exporter protein D